MVGANTPATAVISIIVIAVSISVTSGLMSAIKSSIIIIAVSIFVTSAFMSAISPLGRLPVSAIDLLLTHKLQIAVKTLETSCTQRRGHLSLQTSLWVIVRAAFCLWNDPWRRGFLGERLVG
jgi:hypothetical protein